MNLHRQHRPWFTVAQRREGLALAIGLLLRFLLALAILR